MNHMGAEPGDLTVEQSSRLYRAINLRTVKARGL